MSDALASILFADEKACVEALAAALPWDGARAARVRDRTVALVGDMRGGKRQAGEMETFLRAYGLNTEEGLALMGLAEALLRIPDGATADALIRDKVMSAEWAHKKEIGGDILTRISGLGLSAARKTLGSMLGRAAAPVIRESMKQSLQAMGRQFVLGQSIGEAAANAKAWREKGYVMSYDMLGEGARTEEDAAHYFAAYEAAIAHLGAADASSTVSVKLSALHSRYEEAQEDRCVPALTEKLLRLSQAAMAHGLGVTVDAEESWRLEISLRIFAGVAADPSLKGWDRLGLAVQAYQKRCFPLVDAVADMARLHGRRIEVRLVKGAYWDTEIKRAQVLGLPGYPVFTRKANTDLSYLACAHRMLQQKEAIYPMFATHNAQTAAAILDLAGGASDGFEFQRLHGMGQSLHDLLLRDGSASRIYAPVGSHNELLPYLVRRLLENGANSSFVNRILDPDVPPETLAVDPVEAAMPCRAHPGIPAPAALYGDRKNSAGIELSDRGAAGELLHKMKTAALPEEAAPLIAGKTYKSGPAHELRNPSDTRSKTGQAWYAGPQEIEQAFASARKGFAAWSTTPSETRAAVLEKAADLLEERREALMALLVREAGKTIPDALAEVREAADFCRYYALHGREGFGEAGTRLHGPTGESNVLKLEGRGAFVCISPWNFPLAIFTGQIAAALMAGNAVIAKPAEQTPLIALMAVRLLHEAGVPVEALHLLPGDGATGAAIVQHKDVAGVAFTGGTDTARAINRTLAQKDGPIVPLIAETGGLNAMIADSSALPERLVDDAIVSAFGSAGQRCSALRLLLLQQDIADKVILMLRGAMGQMRLGNPGLLSTDVGPVIDEEAAAALSAHIRTLEKGATLLASAPLSADLSRTGHFFAPCAWEIPNLKGMDREVFGPVLHVLRYRAADLPALIEELNGKGYGLTFGMHTRIRAAHEDATARIRAGNCYVNRSMTGAVVGVQPFGGCGLSGTGPKAGGPFYLHRFATERVVTIDTTASGGNASLVSLEE